MLVLFFFVSVAKAETLAALTSLLQEHNKLQVSARLFFFKLASLRWIATIV